MNGIAGILRTAYPLCVAPEERGSQFALRVIYQRQRVSDSTAGGIVSQVLSSLERFARSDESSLTPVTELTDRETTTVRRDDSDKTGVRRLRVQSLELFHNKRQCRALGTYRYGGDVRRSNFELLELP